MSEHHAALSTRACELFGVQLPIVQTGMGWVSGPRLTAATANAGGLGILASATMTYEELEAAIKKTKQLTSKPFGVNMRADASDASKRCDLLIREGVKVASFALAPKKDLIAKLKDNGIVVIPSIGAAKHAVKVASWGADAVVVQGGRIIGEGSSRVVQRNDANAHAEREAIRDARERFGAGALVGAVLYSTSRPCALCQAAAAESGIARMIHGADLRDAGAPVR